MIKLDSYQIDAVERLKNGGILCGGVGSGKSITALVYYFTKVMDGEIDSEGRLTPPVRRKLTLYIFTTARKRDTHEWEKELEPFISCVPEYTIDSWNNISKYTSLKHAFVIFDEQRAVGSGVWAKSFVKIAQQNWWIMLSATPGDTWMDYIPVFIANGFYKNRSEFLRRHAVYNRYSRYPKIDRYMECDRLERLRKEILVTMDYHKPTTTHIQNVFVEYDADELKQITKDRWNPFDNEPIRDISQVAYLMRRSVNKHPSRIGRVRDLLSKFHKAVIFYNYDYELEALRSLGEEMSVSEWNGHRHEPIPEADEWAYLVQYTAGAEGWNCVETDTMIFYSLNYSFKTMAQAEGRIDRRNTSYSDLYYYRLVSSAPIDRAIMNALRTKKTFNEKVYIEQLGFKL